MAAAGSREALDLGADGFMQDFGEQVLLDMHFHDGSTGAHDAQPPARALPPGDARRAVDAYRRAHPARRVFFFTRAGYTGRPGSAAYENANFPGDETTDWSRSAGLAVADARHAQPRHRRRVRLRDRHRRLLRRRPYRRPTKELFLRWAEWAALTPFFRLHGSVGRRHARAVDLRRRRRCAIYRRVSRLHLRARRR